MPGPRFWIALTAAGWLLTVVLLPPVLRPDYSPLAQYISELGATGAPYAHWVNRAGYLPFGVTFTLALLGLWRRWRPRGIQIPALSLLFCEPLAWIGSAVFPCDLDCPAEGSLSQTLHNLLGLFTLLGTTLGLILLACGPGLRPAARAGWLLLAATWLALVVGMLVPDLAAIRGGLQRLGEALLYATLAVVGWRMAGQHPLPPALPRAG